MVRRAVPQREAFGGISILYTMNDLKFGIGALGGVSALVFLGAIVLLNIMFMVCLWNDAGRLRERGRSTVVLTPFVWGLSALVLGLVAVALYWLCHYSQFRSRDD